MDFLESASILIPALTSLSMIIYEKESDILSQFEEQYCFSPQLQPIYTAKGLQAFFKNNTENLVYDILEPLGSRLSAFQLDNRWILLGPYVEDSWNDHRARSILAKAEASESIISSYKAYRCKLPIAEQADTIQTSFLLIKYAGDGKPRQVKQIHINNQNASETLTFNESYADASVINRRYALEDKFIAALSSGDSRKILHYNKGWGPVTTGIKFITSDMRDQLAAAAITRTLVRMGAKQAGLSPVLIDSISQEYAQRMRRTTSKEELDRLTACLIEDFCAAILAKKKSGYSPWVSRAVEYMSANLSKPMTTQEIANAAGTSKTQLVKCFRQETGITIKQHLAKKRCEIAAELLHDSSASVQEIAAYVGYTDNNYFSKVFKAHYGITPQDYRKSGGTP